MNTENVKFFAEALIGAMESALDRGTLDRAGTFAVREIILRLQVALRTRSV